MSFNYAYVKYERMYERMRMLSNEVEIYQRLLLQNERDDVMVCSVLKIIAYLDCS